MRKINAQVNSAETKNAACKVILNHKTTHTRRWFSNEIRKERRLYEKMIKRGVVDRGYLWASLYLHTFIEGVFTLRAVPSVVEVEVPKGIFRMTTLANNGMVKWLIRNDTFGCIAEVYPQEIAEWAVENYPKGIGSEGYLLIVHKLLTAGCNDEDESQAIWNAMFFEEVDDAA